MTVISQRINLSRKSLRLLTQYPRRRYPRGNKEKYNLIEENLNCVHWKYFAQHIIRAER